ncbi:MAG: hypothetical protein IKZ88_09675 [Neisseriaceae bacterium]|nr:hypothetical protein [Neisseriaceae bacterium]
MDRLHFVARRLPRRDKSRLAMTVGALCKARNDEFPARKVLLGCLKIIYLSP